VGKSKLMIPGPVEVREDVLQAQARPMIGHREKEYTELQGGIVEKLRRALQVKGGHLLLFSSSGTGGMEAGVRNLVAKRVLSCVCGAFSERWLKTAEANGKEFEALNAEWGKGNHAEEIDRALAKGGFDAVHVTHSETSTGVLNRLDEIGAVLKARYPDVTYMVDAVSSMAGVPIRMEEWGIDFIFAGTQKGWGLPPGLCIAWASDRAIEKSKRIPNRGYYFDLPKYVELNKKNQTPETPAISLLYALDFQLDRMLAQGMENRFAVNLRNAQRVRGWALERGFGIFPEKGYEGVTLTCVQNKRGIDQGRFVKGMKDQGYLISDGYGDLKGKTFRIAHMADITEEDIEGALGAADRVLRGIAP
jgi:aspartate aminotransferase-like enzyme